jgi:hypothetical protein
VINTLLAVHILVFIEIKEHVKVVGNEMIIKKKDCESRKLFLSPFETTKAKPRLK